MTISNGESRRKWGARWSIASAAGAALAVGAGILSLAFTSAASASPAASAGAASGAAKVTPAVRATLPPSGDVVTVASHFVWVATSASRSDDSTYINNGATNAKKNDLLFVTPNLTPGGINPCPCLLEPVPPVGVWYDGSQWAVFNEDSSTMGGLVAYNVLVVPKASKYAFEVHATASSRHGDYLVINSAATNKNPKALLQVTQNYNPSEVYNPNQIGVRYIKAQRKWSIFNEDGQAMPLNAGFNVLVGNAASNGGSTAVLTTTKADRAGAGALISNRETNGNPNNVVLETQDTTPAGKGGYGDQGIIYATYSGSKEGLINWDSPPPRLGAAFNLLIFSS
jgi:hypothetical protein